MTNGVRPRRSPERRPESGSWPSPAEFRAERPHPTNARPSNRPVIIAERRPRTFEAAGGLTLLWACVVWFFFASANPQRGDDPAPLLIATAITVLAWCMVIYDAHARATAEQAIAELHQLSQREFDRWVAAYFQRLGYQVRPSASLWHEGVDLVAERGGRLTLVSCGGYRDQVVDEVALGPLEQKLREYGAHRACYITTGRLTRDAHLWLRRKPIDVWDRGYLAHLLRAHRLPTPPAPSAGSVDEGDPPIRPGS